MLPLKKPSSDPCFPKLHSKFDFLCGCHKEGRIDQQGRAGFGVFRHKLCTLPGISTNERSLVKGGRFSRSLTKDRSLVNVLGGGFLFGICGCALGVLAHMPLGTKILPT